MLPVLYIPTAFGKEAFAICILHKFQNEYIDQFENKFQLLLLGFHNVYFKIISEHLNEETANYINQLIENCSTGFNIYQKLYDKFFDVIARTTEQEELRFLSKVKIPNSILLLRELCNIREIVSIVGRILNKNKANLEGLIELSICEKIEDRDEN